MRDIDSATMAALDDDRIISAKITVRDTLLRFDEVALNDSAVSALTFYRASTWTSGTSHMLRVAIVSNSIWAQYGTDFGSLGSWSNQSISVKAGSGIGMFGDKIWYQDASGNMQERVWGGASFGAATQRTPTGWSTALVSNFDGVGVSSVYYMQQEYNVDGDGNDIYHSSIGIWDAGTTYQYPGEHYDKTSTILHFNTVRGDNPINENIDFIIFATNGGDKSIFMTREGENWSAIEDLIPLDIVDDTSKFIVGGTFTGANMVWVTGRLVRSSGTDLQVYMMLYKEGDWEPHVTMGREYFICEHTGTIEDLGMTVFYDGSWVWAIGLNHRYRSTPSYFYGTDLPARKEIILNVEDWTMSCGHNNATQLMIKLDPSIDDPILDHGNALIMQIAYNSNWSDMGEFIIEQVVRGRDKAGNSLSIRCVDEVGYRLSTWAADADYDYWGPYKQNTYANDLAGVLRGQGDWEDVGDTELKNTEQVPYIGSTANSIVSTLLSLKRPARNGMQMAKFTPSVDATGKRLQEWGLVLNYYNEQKYEAEERGASMSFASYGVEMFAVLYGDKCANGSKGIGLYKFMPYGILPDYHMGFPTLIASQVIDLGTTDKWLAAIYTDGEFKIYYRSDSVQNWTKVIETKYTYDGHYPYYDMRKRGRSGVWLSNPTYYFQTYPFKSDGLYIPFSACTAPSVPTSDNLICDNEHLSYDGKDSNANNTNGYNNFWFDGHTDPGATHTNPYSGPFVGEEIYFTTNDPTVRAHDYYNDMVVVVVDGSGKGQTYKITDYDYVAPDQWVDTGGPYTYPDTWKDHIGDVAYGYWDTVAGLRRVFVLEEPSSMLGPTSKMYFAHRLDVDARGLDDTTAASHDQPYTMFYRPTVPVVEEFIGFSGERDLTFDYIAKSIARKAGIRNVVFDNIYDGGLLSFSHAGFDMAADHALYWNEGPDAVIDMYINAITGRIGIALTDATVPGTGGTIVLVDDTNVEVWAYSGSGGTDLIDRAPHSREMTVKTKVTFVANSNFVSVYIGGALVWATPITEQKEGVTLLAYDTASAYVRWSHLDTVVDSYIMDMGSSGMQSLGRLIGEKHINFQHDENILRFFKDRVVISGSPWDYAIQGADLDDESPLVTRLRLEGVDIFEHTDLIKLKQYGNLFRMAHSEDINTVGELEVEAEYIVDDSNAGINRTTLDGAADPRVEPDDILEVTFTGSDRADTRDIIVEGVSFSMRVSAGDAVFDMSIEGKDA